MSRFNTLVALFNNYIMKYLIGIIFLFFALNSFSQTSRFSLILNSNGLQVNNSIASEGTLNINTINRFMVSPEFGIIYDRFLGNEKWGIGAGLSFKKYKNTFEYTYPVWNCNGGVESVTTRSPEISMSAWGLRFNVFYQWKKWNIKGIFEVNSPFKNTIETNMNSSRTFHVAGCSSNSYHYDSVTIEYFYIRASGNPYDYVFKNIIVGYRITDKLTVHTGFKMKFGKSIAPSEVWIYDNKNDDNSFNQDVDLKQTIEVEDRYFIGYIGVSYDFYWGE